MFKLLACLALLVFTVSAQLTLSVSETTYDVATWSDWIYIETASVPNTTFTITPLAYNFEDDTNVPFQIQPPTLTFSPTVQVQSFRVYYGAVGSYYLNFSKSDDGGQFNDVGDLNIEYEYRTFDFFQWGNLASRTLLVKIPSEPYTIFVSTAPAADLTLTPTAVDGTIIMTPAVIRAGTLSGTFTVQGIQVGAFTSNITWTLQGDNEGYYYRDSLDQVDALFNIQPRQITITSADVNIQLGSVNSTGISVFLREQANETITLTPQAADTEFQPASVSLGGAVQEAFFTFKSLSNEINGAPKNVYFHTAGDGRPLYVENPAPVTFIAPKRQVTVNIGAQNVVTNRTYMSITIPAPVKDSLSVTFTASNVKFNVSSVEFRANVTAFTVELTHIYLGEDAVFFVLSGADADADLYEEIPSQRIGSIIRGNFIGPADWYIPALYVGEESDKIPVRVSISPRNAVTITPSASNLIFRPKSLTFRNGTEQQYFTITPLYTSNTTTYDAEVTWFINGTDHIMFDLPSDFSVRVSARKFQAVTSAHFVTADIDGNNIAQTRHLRKTYKIWTSVNYIGKNEHLSVTPTSPFYSFKPAVLFFNQKNTRIELEATVTGVPADGQGRIDYIYGGQDGGLYIPVPADNWRIALRPLEIVAAVVTPDERNQKGIFLVRNIAGPNATGYDPVSVGALRQNHVQSFKIRSFVLPDRSLTITPKCAHATFSPSKITIKGDDGVKTQDYWPEISDYTYDYYFNTTGVYLEANFTVKHQAAGIHEVWFELSGHDADYYDRVPHTEIRSALVMRPKSEPYRASSSSYLLPSFVVVGAMAVFALVM